MSGISGLVVNGHVLHSAVGVRWPAVECSRCGRILLDGVEQAEVEDCRALPTDSETNPEKTP